MMNYLPPAAIKNSEGKWIMPYNIDILKQIPMNYSKLSSKNEINPFFTEKHSDKYEVENIKYDPNDPFYLNVKG